MPKIKMTEITLSCILLPLLKVY